ncbi:hypothetical protein SAMN04244548_04648 [Paracoccus pantotrophus]|nr:hypothetical protein SAMN04244548_04648 [Paracoccus pantotrophus]
MADFTAFRHPLLAVACPACGAAAGTWCRRPSGHRAADLHRARGIEDNTDTIQLMNLGVTTFAQARTHATQNGADVVFDFGSGDTLTVRNTTINALADDMIFS